MLSIIQTEFMKMKRQNIIVYSLLTAFILPIIMTIFSISRSNMDFGNVFRTSLNFGSIMFLPSVLGMVITSLFYTEKENDTLKSILIVPVGKVQLMFAKFIVIVFISLIYMILMFIASLLGGVFTGGISHVSEYFSLSIFGGLLVPIAILPILFVVIFTRKGYIFSISITLIYSFISFIILGTGNNLLTPLVAVVKLYLLRLGQIQIEKQYPVMVILLTGIIAIISSIIVFKKQDV